MVKPAEESGGLLQRILTSVFEQVTSEEAVALVGILYEYRIVLSKEFWSLLRKHSWRFPLEPLEPQAASVLVADLFNMDCDALFMSFHKRWSALKGSPVAKGVIARIKSHELVERLEAWSRLP
ncbi:MAG: hypothetical protein ACYTG0_22220 [Planctomycetota bacterium]|jgi:hypothetical protein